MGSRALQLCCASSHIELRVSGRAAEPSNQDLQYPPPHRHTATVKPQEAFFFFLEADQPPVSPIATGRLLKNYSIPLKCSAVIPTVRFPHVRFSGLRDISCTTRQRTLYHCSGFALINFHLKVGSGIKSSSISDFSIPVS